MSDLRRATERIEREEFARGHIGAGETPATPRPAATIVVAWIAPEGRSFQVLLLRRPDTTRFAAGAYVFPGGVIDEDDASPAALSGLPPGLREREGAAAVAALRELFEETLLLPCDRAVDPQAAREQRAALLAGERGWIDAMRSLGATFQKLEAAYLARWITPARFARRYDTRFFLTLLRAPAPPPPELTGELAGHLWIDPGEAVRRFARGELPMLFPTRRTLQRLAAEDDVRSLLERCRVSEPEPVEPRLLVRGESVRPVLPGEPGYDDAE